MWSIDLFKRRSRGSHDLGDTRALLLVSEERQQQIVVKCCDLARQAGVKPGMPVGQARALFVADAVRLEEHDAHADRAALDKLAIWAQRLAPTVAVDEPDGLLLDVTGCARVWDGEERLVRSAISQLESIGLQAHAAVAPTFAGAWACARYGSDAVVSRDALRAVLEPLPIEALRLDTSVVGELHALGIDRIRHLLNLPRSTLPVRFGDQVLLRLDQALGQGIETIEPVRPRHLPSVQRVFEGPTDRIEAIDAAVQELLVELCAHLMQRESGVRKLIVVLKRSDLSPERIIITLGVPSRDPQHLWKLIAPKLERTHLGFGVEAIKVHAAQIDRIDHRQLHRGGARSVPGGTEHAVAQLVDTLSNRLGRERVVKASLHESHAPEKSVLFSPAQDPLLKQCMAAVPADRPSVLFEYPTRAEVITLLPDGPVHRLSWHGGEHVIVVCLGPERLSPEWWRGAAVERDYFKVQSESGLWLWVCRSGVADRVRWGVHGVWA